MGTQGSYDLIAPGPRELSVHAWFGLLNLKCLGHYLSQSMPDERCQYRNMNLVYFISIMRDVSKGHELQCISMRDVSTGTCSVLYQYEICQYRDMNCSVLHPYVRYPPQMQLFLQSLVISCSISAVSGNFVQYVRSLW